MISSCVSTAASFDICLSNLSAIRVFHSNPNQYSQVITPPNPTPGGEWWGVSSSREVETGSALLGQKTQTESIEIYDTYLTPHAAAATLFWVD
jgi:hypothetical protein